jgi:hypothetical protein
MQLLLPSSPLLRLGRFFQFLNPIRNRLHSLDVGSAGRKAAGLYFADGEINKIIDNVHEQGIQILF